MIFFPGLLIMALSAPILCMNQASLLYGAVYWISILLVMKSLTALNYLVMKWTASVCLIRKAS